MSQFQIDPATGERIQSAAAQIDPSTGERTSGNVASALPPPHSIKGPADIEAWAKAHPQESHPNLGRKPLAKFLVPHSASQQVADTMGGVAGMVPRLFAPPKTDTENKIATEIPEAAMPIIAAKRALIDPQISEWEKGNKLAALVPLFGPIASSIYEAHHRGEDVSASLQSLMALSAAHEVAPKIEQAVSSVKPRVVDALRKAGPGVDVARDLAKKTGEGNAKITTENKAAEGKHFTEAQDAAHETRGREIEHQRGVRAAEENARQEQSRLDAEHVTSVQNALHETQGRELAHEQAVKATDEANAKVTQEHAAKVKSVEEVNAAKAKEYAEAKTKAEQIAKDAKETETQRGKLARQVKEHSARMVERIKRVKAATKDKIDAAYAEIREKTKGSTVPREDLATEVRDAETKLKGSSENIKVFRDILSKAEDEEGGAGTAQKGKGSSLLDNAGEDGKEMPPADFSQLQGYYSELGDKLSGGNLPADVYLALKELQQAIGIMMDEMAGKHGVGAKLKATRSLYRDYMHTFRESAGPNHSGSPLSQVFDAADPDYAVKPLTEEATAARVRNMMARFDPATNGAGGAAQLYDNFRNVMRQYEGLGNPITVPEVPSSPISKPLPGAPTLKAVEPPPRVEIPDRPGNIAPKYPEPPSRVEPSDRPVAAALRKVGAEELRSSNVEDFAKKRGKIVNMFNHAAVYGGVLGSVYEAMRGEAAGAGTAAAAGAGVFGIGQAIGKLLERPEVVKFFTEPTEKQIAEIPPEMRGDLTQAVKQAQAQGVKVDPRLLQAIGMTGAAMTPKKVGDFLK